MKDPILRRILNREEGENLFEALAKHLTPTDLQSLLLGVFRTRAGAQSPAQVLAHYQNNRFVTPGRVDPRILTALDSLAFSLLPSGTEPLALSPVCPTGHQFGCRHGRSKQNHGNRPHGGRWWQTEPMCWPLNVPAGGERVLQRIPVRNKESGLPLPTATCGPRCSGVRNGPPTSGFFVWSPEAGTRVPAVLNGNPCWNKFVFI